MSLPHQDPADRFLVATALTYELTLVTADETLIEAKACPDRCQTAERVARGILGEP